MRTSFLLLLLAFASCVAASAQRNQVPNTDSPANPSVQQNDAPPRSEPGDNRESSSADSRIDITPPKNDTKDHPNSGLEFPEDDGAAAEGSSDVQEAHAFNPYRAVRDNNVGDFYFKRGNYRAALARYQDALNNKERDAAATYGIALCYEKLNDPAQAAHFFAEYLKILPNGPQSKEAHKALKKLAEKGYQASSATP